MRCLLISLTLFLGIIPSAADEGSCLSSSGRSVRTHGTGVVSLRPDKVSFRIGIETRNPSVAEAYRINRSGVNDVVAALKQKGVTEEQMQTSYFDISTIDPQKGQPRTFKVESVITVARADPASVGSLLQAAISAGANQAGSLQFLVEAPAQSHRLGLELAFQDARIKAEALASLSKRTLGEVVCVTDDTVYLDSDTRSRLRSLGYVGAGGIEAGIEHVTFNVSVVFELK